MTFQDFLKRLQFLENALDVPTNPASHHPSYCPEPKEILTRLDNIEIALHIKSDPHMRHPSYAYSPRDAQRRLERAEAVFGAPDSSGAELERRRDRCRTNSTSRLHASPVAKEENQQTGSGVNNPTEITRQHADYLRTVQEIVEAHQLEMARQQAEGTLEGIRGARSRDRGMER